MEDSGEDTDRGGTPRVTDESTTDGDTPSGEVGTPVRGRPAGEPDPDSGEGETPDAGTEDTTSSPQTGTSEPPGAATALRSGLIGPLLKALRSSRLSVDVTQRTPSSNPIVR